MLIRFPDPERGQLFLYFFLGVGGGGGYNRRMGKIEP